jgi:predicted ester cyclase
VHRFATEFLAKADAAAAAAVIDADVVVHTGLSPSAPIQGRDAYASVLARFAAAFPVGRMEIHEIMDIGEDRVLLRFTAHTTHAQDYYGIVATGRAVPMHEVHLLRLRDGRIVENMVGALNLVFEMLMAPAIGPMVLA